MRETVSIKVITNAPKSRVVGKMADGSVKIRVKAKPIAGKANDALRSYLSDVMEIDRENVQIISGLHSRRKVIQIKGINQKIDWDSLARK